jgi:hypothetical protein
MNIIHIVLFTSLIMGSVYLYLYIYRASVLFDDRFSMTVSIVGSASISFLFGLHLSIIFNSLVPDAMVLAGTFGTFFGYIFGSFSKRQFIISGVFNGFTSGVMGAMAGQVLMNPALCGLPWNFQQIQQNMIIYNMFASIMVFLTLLLLLYSFKV